MTAENTIPKEDLRYLKLLAKRYPNINAASTEIINLEAILNLPKGTEHFLSDIHGEYESFNHVLRNASGVIKNQIRATFGTEMREGEMRSLATLIYYPEQKLEQVAREEADMADWFRITLNRLVTLCKVLGSKYSGSKVRKALPPDYAYILEELLHENKDDSNKQRYFQEIIDTIIRL